MKKITRNINYVRLRVADIEIHFSREPRAKGPERFKSLGKIRQRLAGEGAGGVECKLRGCIFTTRRLRRDDTDSDLLVYRGCRLEELKKWCGTRG